MVMVNGIGNYEKTLDLIAKDFLSHFNSEHGEAYKTTLQHVENLNDFFKDLMPSY